jgi:plasmid maintenance system antidote protein VapI
VSDDRHRTREPTHWHDVFVSEYLDDAEWVDRLGPKQARWVAKYMRRDAYMGESLAVGLSKITDTTPEFWTNLQLAHDEWKEVDSE